MYLAVGNAIDPHTREKRPLPFAYVEYYAMRYIYHCSPLELAKIPYGRILMDYNLAVVENDAQVMKSHSKF